MISNSNSPQKKKQILQIIHLKHKGLKNLIEFTVFNENWW